MSECTTRRLSTVDVNAASQKEGSPASKRPKVVHDSRPTTTDPQTASTTAVAASSLPSLASQSIFTFSLGKSPKKFQVLSCHNLEDLVDIAFQACDPADGETPSAHMWNIKVGPKTYGGGNFPCMGDLSLKPNTTLLLHYDYGRDLKFTLNVESIDDAQTLLDDKTNVVSISDFPRVQPMPPPPPMTFSTDEVDLSACFPALDRILKRRVDFSLFQVGRRRLHGFIKSTSGVMKMVLLPDKPVSLSHLLKCMDVGAGIKSAGMYNWHSVVILPSDKLVRKYGKDLEPGFCDCRVVLHHPLSEDFESIFPKFSALAGFAKDKRVPRGWITYGNDVLQVVQGYGSYVGSHALKGCAFDGDGAHKPAGDDKILLRIDKKMESLHELFCRVEGFLATL
ncbi:hypothetical protein IV203_013919 [Nitzschia inconspicua]|uniref:Uncharacterized protein n=1 Tax=Nitzschia inconspicua TaxID=303405 RepID=A0A9K3M610_9STRA|nr:hypothetical protein IV203_013919 [Nitzschia inconspicua]